MTMLEVDCISKSYGRTQALQSVSLTVESGTRVALVGPSGAGKSTLLRIIAGLEKPDSGSLRLANVDCSTLPPKMRQLGFVFQDYAIYPRLRVDRNIATSLTTQGLAKSDIQVRVQEQAHALGISDLLHRFPHQLSGGQLQRVALAKAMIRRPHLLLLDEPLSQIDLLLRHQLRQQLELLHEKTNVTIIMVTHDAEDALGFANRVAVLNAGKLVRYESPDQICAEPQSEFESALARMGRRIND